MIQNFLNGRITGEDTFQFTLADILKLRANETPEKTVYIYLIDGESDEMIISYRKLYYRARNIAAKLTGMGMYGKRALMLYPPGPGFIFALFGCFIAGVIAVPAYPPKKNRSLSRIVSIVGDCNPDVILSTKDIFDNVERNFSEVTELKDLKWIITDELFDDKIGDISLPNPVPEDIALLQYTSGSTGTPKGVVVSHRNIMRNSEFLRQCFELSQQTMAVHWLPVFHDMGLVFGVLQPLYTGYTGILMPPVSFIQKPVRWLNAISRYKAHLGGAPNFAYDLCVTNISDEECEGMDLRQLRTLYNGAEPVRRETLERFISKFKPFGFAPENFYPTYGMAEATLILSGGKVNEKPVYLYVDPGYLKNNKIVELSEEDPNTKCLVSVGHPWIDTDIVIADPDKMTLCAKGEVGETWVSGSIVANGYWNKPHDTAQTFQAFLKDLGKGPFLRTGDLGFYYKGELFIAGRLKDLIIIRGRNYYPQDLEYLVENSHPAIRNNCSAAFSVENNNEEKLVITAEVERTWLRNLNVEEICDQIRMNIYQELELEVYAIQLLRTASIPKTSSGKIQRKACREEFLNGTLEAVGTSYLQNANVPQINKTPDIDSLKEWLTSWIMIRFNLNRDQILPDRPVVAYGLNSIKAIELQQAFMDRYKIDFPPYLFFKEITLEGLAMKANELIIEQHGGEVSNQ